MASGEQNGRRQTEEFRREMKWRRELVALPLGVLMRAAASKYYHSKFHPQQVHRASVAVGMAAPPAANKVG